MARRRALVASYYVPQEDRDSGARRLLDFVRFLRDAGWQVDFVAANGLADLRYVRLLQQLGVAVHNDAPRADPAGGYTPSDQFERLLTSIRFDLALLAFWPVAELYLPVLRRLSPRTRVVVDTLDLHFLRDARRILRPSAEELAPPLLDEEFGTNMVGELNTYTAADAVMTVSRKEAELLGDFLGNPRAAHVVPDCEDLDASPLPLADRIGILLLGSYQHPPNVEALEYLCHEVLPLVDPKLLARHPVYVVGNGLDESQKRIVKGVEHVRVVGWVPSVVPYFHRSRITAIPLLHGAGTKRKMIQALMTGTPTVSTSVGTEGLDLISGEHVLVADDPAAFANGIERLLTDDDLCGRLAAQGRMRIVATHCREAVRSHFLEFADQVVTRPVKPAMLPERTRDAYQRRIDYQHHQRLSHALDKFVRESAPTGSVVLVASGGSSELVKISGFTGWHFPRDGDGRYRNTGFADGTAAVNHLEALRAEGGDLFVVPSISFWILDHYPELRGHLDARYRLVGRDDEVGLIYDLRPSTATYTHPERQVPARFVELSPRPSVAVPFPASATGAPRPPRAPDRPADPPAVKLIAFYLPQFHPIPENDRWWGEGFTEWRNVVKAKPLFPGHHQPKLPTDLGYYDLRCPETLQEQADLARRHGIHGFCYYHYWFNGKRLLERPFNEVLRSGKPDLPFCLCWANEPWSRRWDGSETDVLQPQSYGAEDDQNHIRWLLDALADPRAITIDGRPVFLVYRADQLPDPARTTDVWRREVEQAGLKGIYLMAVETGWDAGWDATKVGFDAKVLFQPQFSILGTVDRMDVPNPRLRVYDYQKAWPVLAQPDPVPYLRYESVFPSWDNTARKGEEGWVVHNSTPEAYEKWLRLAVERALARPAEQRMVFLNAWNEWAEGAHLEPDRSNGRVYLEVTRRAVMAAAAGKTAAATTYPGLIPGQQSPVTRAGI